MMYTYDIPLTVTAFEAGLRRLWVWHGNRAGIGEDEQRDRASGGDDWLCERVWAVHRSIGGGDCAGGVFG